MLCFLVLYFVKDDSEGRLMTELSITSVTAFMSCLFADVMTAESDISFLSVKIVPFCLALFASISGIAPSHRLPKGDFIDILSIDCCIHFLIPICYHILLTA